MTRTTETEAAVKRVRAALEGVARKPSTAVVEDADGRLVTSVSQPWAHVLAGDVAELCKAAPMDTLSPVAKTLWRGTKDVPPDKIVSCNSGDLWHLLELLDPPAEPAAEPAPDQPKES